MDLEKAEVLFDQGKFDLALKYYLSHLSSSPNDLYGLCKVAICYKSLNEVEKAFKVLEDCFQSNPRYYFVNYLLAVYQAYDKTNVAEEHANTCLSLEPENEYSFYAKALICFNKKDMEEALSLCKSGLRIDPKSELIKELLGTILMALNKNESAEKLFTSSIQDNPNDDYSHYILGVIYHKKKQLKKAKQHLGTALSLAPNSELYREELIDVIKSESKIYNFFIKHGFGRFEYKPKFDGWFVIKIILCLKVLPIIIGLVTIYLLACWYMTVWQEGYLSLKKQTKHLLTHRKKLRFKMFLAAHSLILSFFTLGKMFSHDVFWLLFWITTLSIPFMISYFEIETKKGKWVWGTFTFLLIISMLIPYSLSNSDFALIAPVILGFLIMGIYGITFSLNGIK